LQALLLGANDLSNFTNLSALDFADALPFSAYEVRVPYNRMTFEDILPNMPLTQIAPGFFTYAPQDSIFSDTTITRTAGQNLTIDLGIDASITTNVYQWFKNGNPWQTVTGVNKWDFTGLLPTDAGEYWVHVTNPNAPLLKLESYNITLVVQPNGCNATTERAALEAFYDATNGDNWTNKTNWKTNKPLYEWYGITVNNNGCVQCIDMDGDPNACFATSLANGNNLVGTLSPSVGQLQQLEQLILYKNKLTGNIPPEIGNLSKLKVLVLARNQFANSIPASLYQLTDLIILELSSNLLTGSISPQIGNLVNLDFLSLASNNLSGVIPIQIGSLLKLRILALQSNFFTGDIPTQLNQLPILYTCFLNNNRFSAAANLSVPPFIPDSIPPYFRGLRLGNNQLTFDDILPSISKLNMAVTNTETRYAPQADFYSDTTITRIAGQLLTIDLGIDAGLTSNIYQWNKNGISWTPPAGNIASSNKLNFPPLTINDAGEYYVSVTNPNAPLLTLKSRKITIVVQPDICAPLQSISILPANTAFCTGKSTTLTPTGTWTTFNWSNGLSTPTLNVNTAGQYRVTVTNSDGCALSDTITVAQNALPVASILNSVNTGCIAPTGSIDLNVTGGTGGYTYLWSNTTTAQDLTTAPAGTYTVTTTDANGCTTTSSATIATSAAPVANIVSTTNSGCTTPTGSIDLNVTGGTGGYTYNWSNNTTMQDITAAPAGVYSVTTTDANGCTATSFATIATSAAPVANIVSTTNSGCTTPTGSIDLNVTGGTGGYTYLWSNNATAQDITTAPPSIYTVTVTDQNGCTTTSFATIATSAAPVANIVSTTNSGCATPTGSIDLNVTGGTGGYTYNWSNNTTMQDLTAAPPSTYTVTVTDQNGCTTTTTSEILQGPPPPVPVISGSTVLCNGTASLQTGSFSQYLWSNSQITQSINVGQIGQYSITVTDTNGCTGTAIASIGAGGDAPMPQITGPTAICSGASVLTTDSFAAYKWSTGATSAAITVTSIGNYGLTVTAQNGCTGTATTDITTTADAPLPVIVGLNTLCNGSTTLHISGNYPNPPKWSTGETSDSISVQTPGNYSVTVTDNNGCTGTDSATITQGGNFTVTATADGNTSFCEGSNVLLKSTPATGQTYQWQRNGSNIPNATDANYLADSTGNYTLLVTIDGCTSTSTPIAVTVLPAPKITILAIEKALCGDNTGSIEIALGNAFGNVTYAWSNGAITKNTKDMAPGQYQITVTNGNACTSTASVEVGGTVPPQPEIVGPSKIKPGETLILITPLDYSQYEWSNGKISPSIEITLPGIYAVTVTDADGCTGTATKEVETDVEDLLKDIELLIPRAFSPYTTPGENDGFDPVKALIDAKRPVNLAKEIRLTVYARNGEALVILSPYPEGGWSGELIPPNLPEGAYYYVLEFVFEDGKKAIYKAALNLAK
jgi:hypothetical protein